MASGSLSGSTGSLGPTGSNIVTLTGGSSSSAIHGDGKGVEVTREEWISKLETQHLARADMNKLIMNYLVTEGFKEAAEKFQKESGVETSVDLDSIDLRIKIKELILQVFQLRTRLFQQNIAGLSSSRLFIASISPYLRAVSKKPSRW